MELRDTGDHGFVLPPEQIMESGEETILALVDMCHSIAIERGLMTPEQLNQIKAKAAALV